MGSQGAARGAAAPFRRTAMRTRSTLELQDAELVIEACVAAAREARASLSIAVVDDAGLLLGFKRMDAKGHTVDLAVRKARTAAALGLSTAVLEAMAKDG